MTRQDLIDATTDVLRVEAGLSDEEIEELHLPRLRVQEHHEVIRWALRGGERPEVLVPPRRTPSAHRVGWREQSLDEATLALFGTRRPPVIPKSARQLEREREVERERVELEARRRLEAEERERKSRTMTREPV